MKRTLRLLALALALAAPASALAQSVTCELPLFVTQTTNPNVLILLDNSGSMNFLNPAPTGYDENTSYSGPWSGGNLYVSSSGNYTKY
ncbi:MAG: hypothetical protein K8I02_09240, partial [Candidatus Methylomirabilis sp.]|nr:hypothetical protein [Deltaproteobacteria bacterium]